MQPIPETPLDPLLKWLSESDGPCVELRPGMPAEISAPSGRIFGDVVPAAALAEMLAAVTPPERWKQMQRHGRAVFDLDTHEGLFRILLRRSGTGLSAAIYAQMDDRNWPVGSPMPTPSPRDISLKLAGCVVFGIAFLYLVLFPLVDYSKRPSAQSTSLNHVKQLTLAVMVYMQDYDGAFPGWIRNPDGGYAHNTWDEQIKGDISGKDVFTAPHQTGVKSPSDPHKARVLSYAFNGALIAPYDGATGDVDWRVPPHHIPKVLTRGQVADPAHTIVLAQIATDAPPPTTPPGAAKPDAASGRTGERPSREWLAALPIGDEAARSVIDISPRTWVSHGPDVTDAWYNDANPRFSETVRNGVARDLYGGGGTYGFVDGHVKFMRIQDTAGIGRTADGRNITAANWFKPSNPFNMWNPRR
jgi:prepilin-type processing-associated H-X9-DG protein